MRRLSALSLIAAISFLLAVPMLSVPTENRLPACCRRDGKHHCSMESEQRSANSGPLLKPTAKRCSQYPLSSPGSTTGAVGLAEGQVVAHAVAGKQIAKLSLIENSSHLLAEFAHPKRGPPVC